MMRRWYREQLLPTRNIWTPTTLGYACGCAKEQHQAAKGESSSSDKVYTIYPLQSGLESLDGHPWGICSVLERTGWLVQHNATLVLQTPVQDPISPTIETLFELRNAIATPGNQHKFVEFALWCRIRAISYQSDCSLTVGSLILAKAYWMLHWVLALGHCSPYSSH